MCDRRMNGKVWLVGAGPGDPGLFTLKGKKVLEQAEVVVYDSLVGDGVLSMVPREAELINVGKRAGHHLVPQDQINEILLEKALEGKRVVRLKGGDPFLFGRGGEELELLQEHQIPFEVVPGVTSPIAVPAYNGIPVTHRDYCSSVHIITGHKKAGQQYNINFKALVETKGTLVFLMGVTALGDICSSLLDAGMDPDTPAAILQQGTTAGQKKIVATVSTLKAEVDRRGIQTPAIIVVGGVCEVADRFAWYEHMPLFGYKVLLTRPKELVSAMSAKLRRLGAEVLELPAIAIAPVKEEDKVKEALDRLEEYQWIVFTSPSGVRIFLDDLMKKYKADIRRLGNAKIAALGSGTARELGRRGLIPDLIPEVYDGRSLGEKLAEVCEKGAKVLIPRAAIGSHEIIEALGTRTDLQITDLATYDTLYEKSRLIDAAKEFEQGKIHCAVFTSASTVKGFVKALPELDYTKVKAACIGKQTKAAADAFGMETYMAPKAEMDALADLIVEMKNRETAKDTVRKMNGDNK